DPVLLGLRRAAFDGEARRTRRPAQEDIANSAGLADAGQRADALDQLLIESRYLRAFGSFRTRYGNAHCQQAIRPEPRIDTAQEREAADHQARTRQQHHGHRELRDHQRGRMRRALTPPARLRPPSRSDSISSPREMRTAGASPNSTPVRRVTPRVNHSTLLLIPISASRGRSRGASPTSASVAQTANPK